MGEGRRVRIVDPHAALLALLGGDEDHTVGTLSTVEGRSRGARKDRHGFDVVGVEVGDTLEVAAVGRFIRALGLARTQARKRNTVDHVEGVVLAVDRLDASHHHAGGTAGARCAGIDLKAGHLTRKGVHEVGVLDRSDDVTGHLLHVVGQRFLGALDTEGGHHDGVEHLVVFEHYDLKGCGAGYGKGLLGIADQRNFERVADLGLRQREVAVQIDGDAGRRALNQHRGADQRHALSVLNGSAYSALSAVGGGIFSFLRKDDVLVAKRVGDVGTCEKFVEQSCQRLVLRGNGHFAVGVDVRRVVDERAAGLLLNGLENGDDSSVPDVEADARNGLLRLCCGMSAEASQYENRDEKQTTETCGDGMHSPARCKVSFFHGSGFR